MAFNTFTMQKAHLEYRWHARLHRNLAKDTHMIVVFGPRLDAYHQQLKDKNGWLWRVSQTSDGMHYSTSLATGYKAILDASFTLPFTGDDDAVQKSSGSELQKGVRGVSGQAVPDQEAW